MPLISVVSLAVGGLIFLSTLYFALVSHQEEQTRAVRRALLLAILVPLPYLAAALIDFRWRELVCYVLVGGTFLVPLVFLLPIGNHFDLGDDIPKTRIDERDIMFSRRELRKGSQRFDAYYERRPELKALDDKFRKRPGLMQPGAAFYEPLTFAAAAANFKAVGALRALLDHEELTSPAQQFDPPAMTRFIQEWLKRLGTVSVGVTELRDYHLYSTRGRGEHYGEPVTLDHRYAIAFSVEMDHYLLARAPKGPTLMESAQEYLNSGTIAVQLAEFIRGLGYSARAHIDGNYHVVCPLVARDAGLGEIGRMGLLITPELGPRVRLAVVTTDLPLIPQQRKPDGSVIDFCRRCKKCAEVCPSRAISFDDREMIDGARRWQINSEACFTLWCAVGTDCGRCMSVCPYSHPNNILHNLVRMGLRRSVLFRMLAVKMDDFFYGRKPLSLDIPDWIADLTPAKKPPRKS